MSRAIGLERGDDIDLRVEAGFVVMLRYNVTVNIPPLPTHRDEPIDSSYRFDALSRSRSGSVVRRMKRERR